MPTFGITRSEAIQRLMAEKLTRLIHKIAIQLYLVAESRIICSSRSRRPVRRSLDTPSHKFRTDYQFRSDLTVESFSWQCQKSPGPPSSTSTLQISPK